MKMLMASGMPNIDLVVSTNKDSGYNVRTEVNNAGGISVASVITVTLNAQIRIKTLTTGTFPSGSKLIIINNGVIFGAGGSGGDGANVVDNLGNAGSAGVEAIALTTSSGLTSIDIYNANGYILGGGGGAAGGSSLHNPGLPVDQEPGGGGGGGAGGGVGGTKGANATYTITPATNGGTGKTPTWSGSAWTNVATGNGGTAGEGAIGTFGSPTARGQTTYAGANWGAASSTLYTQTTFACGDGSPYYSRAGGAAGRAIKLNSNVTPTIVDGNNSTQVKGAVS